MVRGPVHETWVQQIQCDLNRSSKNSPYARHQCMWKVGVLLYAFFNFGAKAGDLSASCSGRFNHWRENHHCPWNWILVVEPTRNVTAHAQKPELVFLRNGRVHFNRRGGQFSRLLAVEECAVWTQDDWLPTPFASFPFTSPPVRLRVPSDPAWAIPQVMCGWFGKISPITGPRCPEGSRN